AFSGVAVLAQCSASSARLSTMKSRAAACRVRKSLLSANHRRTALRLGMPALFLPSQISRRLSPSAMRLQISAASSGVYFDGRPTLPPRFLTSPSPGAPGAAAQRSSVQMRPFGHTGLIEVGPQNPPLNRGRRLARGNPASIGASGEQSYRLNFRLPQRSRRSRHDRRRLHRRHADVQPPYPAAPMLVVALGMLCAAVFCGPMALLVAMLGELKRIRLQ